LDAQEFSNSLFKKPQAIVSSVNQTVKEMDNGIGFVIDHLADSTHKILQLSKDEEYVDRFLENLEVLERRKMEKVKREMGTEALPLLEVLRSLAQSR
jgi:septation ring formation regulator EzrA